MKLRPYQSDGIARIDSAIEGGARRVLAVAPTGAGKGTMAAWLLARAAERKQRALFLVHRREIVLDVAKRLRKLGVRFGIVLPGQRLDARALVQVASVQSLVRREAPPAELIIPDEAHHYRADEWRSVLDAYIESLIVGFSATPQRGDGKALGDVFETLIDVVSYSELLRLGHIVPCQVLRPPDALGIDLAQDPLTAYRRYANGRPALVFVRRVEEAHATCAEFKAAGIAAAVVHANTGKSERDETLRRIQDGRLTVVINVYALTEGVDVPRVSAIILARTCDHPSTYVQIVGRALRAHPGKANALLLDLTGVSHRHGLPTDDRVYSLEGSGMGPSMPEREGVERELRTPKVLGVELQAVGALTTPDAGPDPKRKRWDALATEVESGTRTVADAVRVYRDEFGERPAWVGELSQASKAAELLRLRRVHSALAPIMYQEIFG